MSEVVAELVAKLGLNVAESEWKRGDQLIDGMKKAAAGLAVWFGIEKIKGWVEGTVRAGDQATKMAQKIGISAESVQELGYAAGQSGSDIESLSGGVFKLSKGLAGDLKQGSGDVLDAFHKMGVTTDTLKKKMSGEGGVDDIINVIADSFQKMEEGPKKTALAMDLFGRSGAQLIPFLNAGSSGISDLRKEANELGIVLDAETGKKLEAFGDDTDRLKQSWAGVRNEIVTAALPVLQAAATWLLAKMKEVVAWFKDHREEIKTFFLALGHAITEVVGFIVEAIGIVIDVIKGIIEVIRFVVDGIIEVAGAIGDTFEFLSGLAGSILEFFGGVIRKLGDAWNWVSLRVIGMWTYIKGVGNQIKDFFVEVGTAIKDAFESAFNFVADLPIIKQFRELIQGINDLRGGTATDNYQNAFAGGSFTGSRDEFEAQRNANIARRKAEGDPMFDPTSIAARAAVGIPTTTTPAGSMAVSGGSGPSTVTVTAPVTINAPSADAGAVFDLTKAHIQTTIDDAVRNADEGR